MVIAKIMGGLASQLEKYIFADRIAKALGQELVLDLSDYLTGYFRPFVLNYLSLPDCKIIDGTKKIGEVIRIDNGDRLIEAYRRKENNLYIYKEGQDYVTFTKEYPEFEINYNWDIFDYVKLKEESNHINDFCSKIEGCYSVAVHIRRGDFVTIGWNNDINDYKSIIGYILLQHPGARFYFFSNDIYWVKEQFGDDTRFSYEHSDGSILGDLEEFFYISLCNQRILSSVSGFGKYANILNWHNGGKEIAITTVLNKKTEGLYNSSTFQSQNIVRTLDKSEAEKGINHYKMHVRQMQKNLETVPRKKEEFKVPEEKYSETKTRARDGIVIVDSNPYNMWCVNDFQCLAISFLKMGYSVLYVQMHSKENEGCKQEAKDPDGKSLGFRMIFCGEELYSSERLRKYFSDFEELERVCIISNRRIVTKDKYLLIRKKRIKNTIDDAKFLIKNHQNRNNVKEINNEMSFIDRLGDCQFLHDIANNEELLRKRNDGIITFAGRLINRLIWIPI